MHTARRFPAPVLLLAAGLWAGAAGPAYAQESGPGGGAQGAPPAPQPAPAAEKSAPPLPEILGPDAVRTADGLVVHYYRVNYVDAGLLAKELERWKSPKGRISAEGPTFLAAPQPSAMPGKPPRAPFPTTPIQNVLRIEDTEENWPVLRRILDLVDVSQPQVEVVAKIVEVTWDDELHVGLESHLRRPLGDTFFRTLDVRFPNRIDALNLATTTFNKTEKFYTFDYLVDLAEAGAHAEVTSKPSVFASQGESALIMVGDREPIVKQTLQGNNVTATTEFQDVGLRLEVQPLLVGRDAVRARVSAELSRISEFRVTATGTFQVVNPVISSRNAETVLTIPDGETLVIGGLEQEVTRDARTGLPLLKDIPVLGWFFGSTTKRKQRTELVFFLTFNVRQPGEARLVVPPSELERTGQ